MSECFMDEANLQLLNIQLISGWHWPQDVACKESYWDTYDAVSGKILMLTKVYKN